MTRTTARLVRLAGGLMAGAIVLAGCSNGSEGSSAESSPTASSSASDSAAHNDADVAFVQGMLPHHEGALAMAQLADGRAQDQRILDLADRIEADLALLDRLDGDADFEVKGTQVTDDLNMARDLERNDFEGRGGRL